MTKPGYSFDKFLRRITLWAKKRDDIRSAIVLGSRARTESPADEWSDLDIVFGVRDPSVYTEHDNWLKKIDEVKIMFLEPIPIGPDKERRVLFACGLDVDFSFAPAARMKDIVKGKQAPELAVIWERGYRILFDKDGTVPAFTPLPDKEIPPLMTEAEFTETANDFWYHAVWTAKKLCRGELWVAMRCCDFYMKRLLLKMIEAHARLMHGDRYDTWYNGRFLEQWTDRRIVKELENCYARYARKDIRRALLATMELFRRITLEIAAKNGYAYPATADEYSAKLVGTLLPE